MSGALFDDLKWERHALPGDAAAGTSHVTVGSVGDDGPTATIVAGIHGDEAPWGALAIRRLLALPRSVLRGRLRVVLAANPLAAAIDGRYAPLDHLDLNEVFPGDGGGFHTERLAHTLLQVLDGTDALIDIHGGGSWCVNSFVFRIAGSEELADEFGAPFIVDMPIRERSITHQMLVQGKKVLAVEMGGRCDGELAWRDRIAVGLARALVRLAVFGEEAWPATSVPPSVVVEDMRVLRPSRGGILVPTLTAEDIEQIVPRGTVLAELLDLHTLEPIENFIAPFDRTAILLLRPHVCRLDGGAMTIIVGQPRG